MEPIQMREAGDRANWVARYWERIDRVLQFALMILAVGCAIIAIAEIAARDSFLSFLNSEAIRISKEIIDRSREPDRSATPGTGQHDTSLKSSQSAGMVPDEKRQMLQDIREIQDLAGRVRLLSELGASSQGQTLESLRNSFQEKRRADDLIAVQKQLADVNSKIREIESQIEQAARPVPKVTPAESDVARIGMTTLQIDLERAKGDKQRLEREYQDRSAVFGFWDKAYRPNSLASGFLLALAIMACGAVGAMVAGMRTNEPTSFHDFALGVASGFICFLGIKGGKYIFLLNAGPDVVAMNPYGSAFAGLLARIFHESRSAESP